MTILKKKNYERDTFRKLRDEISLKQRENVAKNVRLYVDSFVKGYKNIGYIAIYWPLKNEVDIRSLKEKISLALPRCCLLYTSPSPRDRSLSRMPSSA